MRTSPMRKFDFYAWSNFQFDVQDIFLGLFVLMIILVYGFLKAVRKRESNPLYRFYFKGLLLKLAGALAFALVYALYYQDGGDTVAYWWGAESLKNVFYHDYNVYFYELFAQPCDENYFNHYDGESGWPPWWLYKSNRHFFVCKVVSVLSIICPGSFLGVTFIMAFICYNGIWKLYETFCHHFPEYQKNLRIGILYLPSTLFWSSGIMKDTIVLAGVCWIVFETDRWLRATENKKTWRLALRILVWGWLIFSCKPYIIIALAPAWLVWMNYTTLKRIQSPILKYYLLPVLVVGSSFVVFQAYSFTAKAGEFSPENVLDKAVITRNDFAYNKTYGENRYQAQRVEKNASGLVAAIPESLIVGLFRPFIWEARSPFIFFSSIENLFILGYFIYALIKMRLHFFKFMRSHQLLLFSIMFSVVLAYIVGFTTVVFGALIRFRTPFLPFFVSFIVITAGKLKTFKVTTTYETT